jgi:hypothetical protein
MLPKLGNRKEFRQADEFLSGPIGTNSNSNSFLLPEKAKFACTAFKKQFTSL